jgi:hypothetical protein
MVVFINILRLHHSEHLVYGLSSLAPRASSVSLTNPDNVKYAASPTNTRVDSEIWWIMDLGWASLLPPLLSNRLFWSPALPWIYPVVLHAHLTVASPIRSFVQRALRHLKSRSNLRYVFADIFKLDAKIEYSSIP